MKQFFTVALLLINLAFNAAAQGSFQETLAKTTEYDMPYATIVSPDGNYVIGAETVAGPVYTQTNYKYFVTKLNTTGAKIWSNTYYPGGGIGRLRAMKNAPGGGYILAGNSMDTYAIKVDDNGNVMWAKMYGDTLFDECSDVVATRDAGFLYTGISSIINSPSGVDMFLIKTNGTGGLQWMSKYTTSGNQEDALSRVTQLADGSYVATGSVRTNFHYDLLITHISAAGNILWAKKYVEQLDQTQATGIVQTPDGGFMVTGTSNNGNQIHSFAMKIDANGNSLFYKRYGTTDNNYPNQIIRAIDGSYAISGYDHQSPVSRTGKELLLRIDEQGTLLSVNIYGVFTDEMVCVGGLSQTNDGGYVFSSGSQFGNTANDTRYDVFVTKVTALRSSGIACDFISAAYSTEQPAIQTQDVTFTRTNYGTEKTVTANVVVEQPVVTPTAACQQSPILPVNSIQIDARAIGRSSITINWNIIFSNINTGKFFVERSADGVHFSDIVTLNFTGNYTYRHTDNNAIDGNNYYRIKYVGADGNAIYSATASVRLHYIENYIAFTKGNPIPKGVDANLQVFSASGSNTKAYLSVYDAMGSLINTLPITIAGSGISANIVLPSAGWASGLYTLVLRMNNNIVARSKLVIN